jgi:hypothetical protein
VALRAAFASAGATEPIAGRNPWSMPTWSGRDPVATQAGFGLADRRREPRGGSGLAGHTLGHEEGNGR